MPFRMAFDQTMENSCNFRRLDRLQWVSRRLQWEFRMTGEDFRERVRSFWDFLILFSGISTARNLSRTRREPVQCRGLFLFQENLRNSTAACTMIYNPLNFKGSPVSYKSLPETCGHRPSLMLSFSKIKQIAASLFRGLWIGVSFPPPESERNAQRGFCSRERTCLLLKGPDETQICPRVSHESIIDSEHRRRGGSRSWTAGAL